MTGNRTRAPNTVTGDMTALAYLADRNPPRRETVSVTRSPDTRRLLSVPRTPAWKGWPRLKSVIAKLKRKQVLY